LSVTLLNLRDDQFHSLFNKNKKVKEYAEIMKLPRRPSWKSSIHKKL